jgi:hypothetical protein
MYLIASSRVRVHFHTHTFVSIVLLSYSSKFRAASLKRFANEMVNFSSDKRKAPPFTTLEIKVPHARPVRRSKRPRLPGSRNFSSPHRRRKYIPRHHPKRNGARRVQNWTKRASR